jgi:hypothetical protein
MIPAKQCAHSVKKSVGYTHGVNQGKQKTEGK